MVRVVRILLGVWAFAFALFWPWFTTRPGPFVLAIVLSIGLVFVERRMSLRKES